VSGEQKAVGRVPKRERAETRIQAQGKRDDRYPGFFVYSVDVLNLKPEPAAANLLPTAYCLLLSAYCTFPLRAATFLATMSLSPRQ